MSKITAKSNKSDIYAAYLASQERIAKLESEVETLKGCYDDVEQQLIAAEAQINRQQSDIPSSVIEQVAVLTDERNALIIENQRLVESCIAAHQRCDALEAIIASQPTAPAQPKPAPKPQPARPASDDIVGDVIQITDADRSVYRKFKALPREQRLAIFAWARPQFGHIGIHNIQAVRAAWHEYHNPANCADEANLAVIAESTASDV
jgi:hypothetical protein